ncbi:hypothetical protein KKH26_03535 [Patescibacteria group bacterium]|nr:hypothetical protein [Patescibacteria group bacterium]
MTKTIVLISCVSKKLNYRAKVKDLYISPLFKYSLAYARKLNPDAIYILSAKHGLVGLNEYIEPYNETLNEKGVHEIKEWSEKVITQISAKHDLKKDMFIFLAGNNYRNYILPYIKNCEIPLKGLGIGQQLAFLKNEINN